MAQFQRHPVTLAATNLSASSTGVWSYTAPTGGAKGFWAKTAVAENAFLNLPFSIPGAQYDQYGAKLISINIPAKVNTADLTGVITASLVQFNDWKPGNVPNQNFTAAVAGPVFTFGTRALPVGTPVTVSSAGTLPAGLLGSTTYFVGNVNGLTFQLFATQNAALASLSPIQVTDTGSGSHSIFTANIDSQNVPVTVAGNQVASSAFDRTISVTVNTPAYEVLDVNGSQKYGVSYGLILTVPTAAGTILRLYDPYILSEATYSK